MNWLFIARPLREQSERYGNALTIPEFFQRRFDDGTHLLRSLSALCILAFFVFYTAAGLIAGGKLFVASFGLPYANAVVLGACLIVVYTSFGGFLAVAWTDALQAALMFFALVTVAGLALWHGADPHRIANVEVSSLHLDAPVSGAIIVSSLAWGLGYFGQPHILNRFMAIREPEKLGRARKLAISWTGIALGAAIMVGFSAHDVLETPLIAGESEKVLMHLIELMLHPAVAGICLAAILAAIMSTADSQLLVCTSVITEDLYRTFLNRDAEESELVRMGRFSVLVIAAIACAIAFDPETRVMGLVSYAWAGFGAAFGPAMLFSLHWRRMTANARRSETKVIRSSTLRWAASSPSILPKTRPNCGSWITTRRGRSLAESMIGRSPRWPRR